MKKNAFTLAETLIVIGIIGVVAALTLPNLNHATGDKEKVTRVKKIYSALNDAYGRAEAVYGPANGWLSSKKCEEDDDVCRNTVFIERLSEFMKVSKFNDNEYYQNSHVLLADGMSFGIDHCVYDNPSDYYDGANYLCDIFVDIDGPNKGKNEEGNDLFTFDITTQGIFPQGINEEKMQEYIFGMHYGAYWVINNENLDYLKVDEEGVCPNGKQLSWTVTSCN